MPPPRSRGLSNRRPPRGQDSSMRHLRGGVGAGFSIVWTAPPTTVRGFFVEPFWLTYTREAAGRWFLSSPQPKPAPFLPATQSPGGAPRGLFLLRADHRDRPGSKATIHSAGDVRASKTCCLVGRRDSRRRLFMSSGGHYAAAETSNRRDPATSQPFAAAGTAVSGRKQRWRRPTSNGSRVP